MMHDDQTQGLGDDLGHEYEKGKEGSRSGDAKVWVNEGRSHVFKLKP